jgi:hypothetical protein
MLSSYILALPLTAFAYKIVLANDDDWAVANIRAQYQELRQLNAARYDFRAVSCPTSHVLSLIQTPGNFICPS